MSILPSPSLYIQTNKPELTYIILLDVVQFTYECEFILGISQSYFMCHIKRMCVEAMGTNGRQRGEREREVTFA